MSQRSCIVAPEPSASGAVISMTTRRVSMTRPRKKTKPAQIWIGTSGWSYQSWRGPFFPREVMVKHHLAFYATQFGSAELNGVFYRTPSLAAVRGWRDQTPDDFVFA